LVVPGVRAQSRRRPLLVFGSPLSGVLMGCPLALLAIVGSAPVAYGLLLVEGVRQHHLRGQW